MAAAVPADDHAALLLEAVETEGREEEVQQARVIGVLHVLEVELPVARKNLAVTAEHAHRLLHHAPDPRGDLLTDVALEGRRRL